MESPVLAAGISLYQAGGLALLLLGIMVIGVAVGFKYMATLCARLGKRIDELEDRQANTLAKTLSENSQALIHLKLAADAQTAAVTQQTDALRARPCLIESGTYHRPTLPPRSLA